MAKVAIWMGHSGDEVGASGFVIEDDITRQSRTWSVAYARACGHTVTTDNDDMSLPQRISASTSDHAGILEWHANSGGGTGTEVWISQYDTGKAARIATAMMSVTPQFGFPNRGVHTSDTNRYGRLGILDTPAPTAFLVETMFVDTMDDVNDWKKNGKAMVEAMTEQFLKGLGLQSTPNGASPANGWQNQNNHWQWLENGVKVKNQWKAIGGRWYYFNGVGDMATGWLKNANKWYYLSPSGDMKVGWQIIGGRYYKLRADGSMAEGWYKEGNAWYYLEASGAMKTGWLKDQGGNWYYLSKPNGAMVTGTVPIDGKVYTFNASGICQNP